jgi:hypothetical protein
MVIAICQSISHNQDQVKHISNFLLTDLTGLYASAILFNMKRNRSVNIILPLLLLLVGQVLAACSPGHLGSNIIAFIRDGQIWTIDPDGANAFAIVTTTTPVVGYSWSPTHQLLAFRSLDESFARTAAARQLSANTLTGQIGDVPSTMNTIGIDGGTPITLAFSNPDVRYSNALWNTKGNRLLYRQTAATGSPTPEDAQWWISQNDQPGGIAAKSFPTSSTIPSFSYKNNLIAGIANQGIFTTSLTGTNKRSITSSSLPGKPLPASLQRILWQPAHNDNDLLYATATSAQKDSRAPLSVQLMLSTISGQTTTLTTCACTQFAWSPDGNSVLYSTGSTYTLLMLSNKSTFTIQGEENSIPYWSPDSHFLLLDGQHSLMLVNVVKKQQSVLLSDQEPATSAKTSSSSPTSPLVQPVANSSWSADSRHFLFLTHDRLLWQKDQLKTGKGLYTVTINDEGQPQDVPVLAATGNIIQAGWTYQDANTSFLYG